MQSNHFEFDLSQTFLFSTKFRSSRNLCLNTIVHHIFMHMKYSDILSLPLFAQSGTIEQTFLYFASQPHITQMMIIIYEMTLKVPGLTYSFISTGTLPSLIRYISCLYIIDNDHPDNRVRKYIMNSYFQLSFAIYQDFTFIPHICQFWYTTPLFKC